MFFSGFDSSLENAGPRNGVFTFEGNISVDITSSNNISLDHKYVTNTIQSSASNLTSNSTDMFPHHQAFRPHIPKMPITTTPSHSKVLQNLPTSETSLDQGILPTFEVTAPNSALTESTPTVSANDVNSAQLGVVSSGPAAQTKTTAGSSHLAAYRY